MKIITTPQKSRNMKAVKSKDTKIEVKLRLALWHLGIRYRKNYKVYSCKPDIVITKYKIAIFCDGDFWHGKENPNIVKRNKNFWVAKIKRNMERDLENTIELRDNGWIVLRYWESDIENSLSKCIESVMHEISTVKNIKQRSVSYDYQCRNKQ